MGLDLEGFNGLAQEIQSQGFPEDNATHYAHLIGDTPCIDTHGRILVIDESGRELAKLRPLRFFSGSPD